MAHQHSSCFLKIVENAKQHIREVSAGIYIVKAKLDLRREKLRVRVDVRGGKRMGEGSSAGAIPSRQRCHRARM